MGGEGVIVLATGECGGGGDSAGYRRGGGRG